MWVALLEPLTFYRKKKKKAFVELKCENDDVFDASLLKEIEKSFKNTFIKCFKNL